MMQNGISPTVSMWVNIAVAVLGVVVSSTAALTTLFGHSTAQAVVTVSGLVLAVLGAVNTALHNYASTQAGPGVINK